MSDEHDKSPSFGGAVYPDSEPLFSPSLEAEQKRLDLKADAERLAELREEYGDLRASGEQDDGSGNPEHMAHLACLIAVYEECAARGLTFGGGR